MLPRLVYGALVVATLSATACDSGSEREGQASSLTVLFAGDERSWAFYVPAQFLVFLPLAQRGKDGQLHGWLARSWEHSADWRTWTVHLRSDVKWHDGVPVTAHDVKFSFELLANPAVGGKAPNSFSVDVLDDTTVVIAFRRRPSEYWLYYDPIYPRHLLEKLDPEKFYDWDFWTRPVGSGPYRYVRHLPKTMMEFAANPEYFLGKPRIDRLVLKYGEPVITELLSGNAHAIPYVQEMELLKLRGDERFRVYSAVKPDYVRAVIWNHRNPLFAEPAIRRALTLAIDRQALLRTLNLPDAISVFDVLFTHEQFYRGEVPVGLRYDLTRAKALLESAGWRDSDGDGVRERAGKKFRFTAVVDQSFSRAAVFIQAQLRAAGVQMDISMMMEARVASDRVKRGDFDAAIWIVNNAVEGGGGHVDYFGAASRIGYSNARAAALLDSARVALDPRDLDRLYRALFPIFEAELPVTFLYPLVLTTVAHRRVKGLSTPYREDPLWYAGELWIEGGRR